MFGGVRIGRGLGWVLKEKKNGRVGRPRRLDKRSALSPPPLHPPSSFPFQFPSPPPASPAYPSVQPSLLLLSLPTKQKTTTQQPVVVHPHPSATELSLAVGPYNPARPRSFERIRGSGDLNRKREGGKEMNSDGLMRWQEYQRR